MTEKGKIWGRLGRALVILEGRKAKRASFRKQTTPADLSAVVDDETTPRRSYHLSRKAKRRRALEIDIAAAKKGWRTRRKKALRALHRGESDPGGETGPSG